MKCSGKARVLKHEVAHEAVQKEYRKARYKRRKAHKPRAPGEAMAEDKASRRPLYR